MKKKMLALLLTALLVCALLAVAASAESGVQDASSAVFINEDGIMEHCLCGNAYIANAEGEVHYRGEKLADGCIGQCDGTMLQWSPTATIPTTAGNWYLTESYTATAMTIIGNDLNLDLNGKTVTMGQGGAARFLRIDKNVSITDTVGRGGFVKDANTTYTIWGTGVWVYNGGKLNLYAGTLDGNNAACTADAADAGVLLVGGGSTFNMYGGTIQNGKASYGGNVKVEGTMYLYDGTISGGTASVGGGNLYVVGSSAAVYMSGGTISGGSGNGNWGGNVTLYNKATMNISGGEIVDGIAGGDAKAIRANMMIRDSVLNISGGYISGGISNFIAAGTINVSADAKIYNDNGGQQITVADSSSTLINLNVTGALSQNAKIMVNGGAAGTVAVNGSGYTLTEADKNVILPAMPGYVLQLQNNQLVYAVAGEESYCVCGGQAVGVGDHTCEDVTWQPWTSTTSLPSSTGNYYLTAPVSCTEIQATAENAQVSIDLRGYAVNFSVDVRSYLVKAGSVLNITDTVGGGKLVKDGAKQYVNWGSFMFINGGTVNLYAGTMEGNHADNTGHSGLIAIDSAGTFNMYGGAVQNGKATMGGNIQVEGAMNLYGGAVCNGTAVKDGAANQGGNIYIKAGGSLLMTGGEIYGGSAGGNWGGNVLVHGQMTMTGGKIYGGNNNADAALANLCLNGSGVLNMSGGEIQGRCGVFNSADAVLNLSGSPVIYNENGGYQLNWNSIDKNMTIHVTDTLSESAKIAVNGAGGDKLPVVNATAEHASVFCANSMQVAYMEDGLYLICPDCVCGGKAAGVGDHKCEPVQWTAWEKNDSLPSSTGNYYLTGPVTLTATQGVAANQKVAIDLRGHTVSVSGAAVRLYNVIADNAALSITDSVGGGSLMRTDESDYTAQGGLLWAWGTNTINLYAGTLDGGNVKNTSNGLINCSGTFNVYGGEIKNGKAANGGNVYMNGGAMNLYKGTISGGAADVQGGNVAIMNNTAFYMAGGSITGGKGHGNWGGNLVVYGGSMTMTGGEITNGITDANGLRANVCLRNTTLNMSDGYISGGVAAFVDAATVNVSGSAKIYNDTEGTAQLAAVTGDHLIYVNVSGALNADACVRIAGDTVVTGDQAVLEAAANKQICTTTANKVFGYNAAKGGLIVQTEGAKVQCVCGGKAVGVGNHVCQEVEFMPWTGADSLPAPADFTATAYYYYLTQDVVCADTLAVYGSGSIAIDLNGHTVTCSTVANAHVYNWVSHGTLSITDSVGGGKVILPEGANSIQGKMFWIRQGVFNLYAGTLDGNNVRMTADGAVVQISATDYPGVFNMYGGVIENGSAKNGGNVKITEGTLNLYGGIIRNGVAQQTEVEGLMMDGRGGNVYINSGCRLNVYGGEISGSEDSVYVMNGGVLAIDGKAAIDNIYLADGVMDLGEDFACDNVIQLNILAGGKVADAAKDYTASFTTDGAYELFYDGNGQIWYGGKIAVVDALGNRTFYTDLQTAVNAASGKECYVKLLADQSGDITVSGVVYLDLNGFELTGNVSGAGTLYCMDSATNDYNCADMGRITGTVSCEMPQTFTAFGKRYMVIADETGCTAHRFYLSVTKTSLKPANYGVGYKAVFYGDEMVQAQVASYGYKLSLEGGASITRTKNGTFVSGKDVTLRINNYDIVHYGDATLSASAILVLADGTVIESTVVSRSFHEIYESVDANFHLLSDEQKAAAVTMYDAQLMAQWNLPNMIAYMQTEADVELTEMNIVYSESISDTTVKQLKSISAQIESETKKKISCNEGEVSANTIYVGIDSTMQAHTFRVCVVQNGVLVTGADQLGAYYGVLYLRDSVMTAPSAVKAEGSWKVCQLDVAGNVPESDLGELVSTGKAVNVLWEKVADLANTGIPFLEYGSTQGGCYDGERYAYQAYVNLKGAGYIIKYDTLDNWKLVTFKYYSGIGHGNDMAYKDGKIYVSQVDEANRAEVAVINASDLSWEGTVTLQGGAVDRTSGIAYNASCDTFVTYGVKDGFTVHNGSLQYARMFDSVEVGLTSQGICCDDNYIYQILWDEGNREDVSDAVMVYDWQGNPVANAELWLEFEQTGNSETYEHMIESKTIYFVDGELYAVLQDWENGVFVAKLQFVRG